MDLKKIIDWIGKSLGRLKTIGVLVLLVLFALSIWRGGCDRQEANDLLEKVTGLDVKNDILMRDVEERDSLLIAKDQRILELQDSLGASDMRVGDLEYDYDELAAELAHLSDSLLRIPADTSYEFLVDEAYPYPGHLKYPFNEPQVKGIHLTFLENIKLDEINLNLLTQINERDYQLELKDTVVYEQAEAIMLMAESRLSLDSIIINKDEVIELQDEQITKVKRSRTIWQILLGAIITVVTALAIGGG